MAGIAADDYLTRIGIDTVPPVDFVGLTTLMQAHLSAVPFENIDVFRRSGVRTDVTWSLDKIVGRHRGGWCFENNGAFGWLLRELGFDTTYLGAYVLLDPPDTKNMSHLCLRVDLDRPYLVDVGFGDSFNSPIPFDADQPMTDGNDHHSLHRDGDVWTLMSGTPPEPQYQFTLTARTLDEFTQQSQRLQTPGTSGFTEKPFATKLIDGGPGRITLLKDRIRTRTNGVWNERPVSPDEWDQVAKDVFGLDV